MTSTLCVFPDRYATGWDPLSPDGATQGVRFEWQEALSYLYPGDSHLHGYSRVSNPADTHRFKKGSSINTLNRNGDDLLMGFLFLDVDLPGHAPWPSHEAKLDALSASLDLPPAYQNWCAFYTTNHGYRLVYQVAEPYSVSQHEALYWGVVRDFASIGVEVDEACHDWTRLYRLPYVHRDGISTAPLCVLQAVPGRLWDHRAIEPDSTHRVVSRPTVTAALRSQPGIQQYEYLLFNGVTGKPTPWLQYAKTKLSGKRSYAHIFDQLPIEKGGRNSAIVSFIGEAIRATGPRQHGLDPTTPEHIFSLLEPVVDALEQDEDWRGLLWRKVNEFWAVFEAEEDQKKELVELQEQHDRSMTDRTVLEMREWCGHPALHSNDPAQQQDFMRAHALAYVNGKNAYHILKPDGNYSLGASTRETLVAGIRQNDAQALIPFDVLSVNAKGEEVTKRRTAQNLIDDHAFSVSKIQSRFTNTIGATVSDLGTDAGILTLSHYRRVGLEPRFDDNIDEWLRTAFGEHYDWICNWLGNALAVEEGPVCALSLKAPADMGKSLLVLGLRECFTSNSASGPEVFGDWTEDLLYSPLVVLNEGIPSGKASPSELFRCLVTGDPIQVNRKFNSNVELRVNFRVLMTANNDRLVSDLVAPKGLSYEDRAAVMQRLEHIDLTRNPRANEYFAKHPGISYRKGQEWVSDDVHTPGASLLARHFLWLHAQRKVTSRRSRLLVEGTGGDELRETLTRSAGIAGYVYEALVNLVHKASTQGMGTHSMMFIDGGSAIVSTRTVLQELRSGNYSGVRAQQGAVSDALKNICEDKADVPTRYSTIMLNPHPHRKPSPVGRYFVINRQWLWAQASESGHVEAVKFLEDVEVATQQVLSHE